jgi:PAS domain S-box-containing protein
MSKTTRSKNFDKLKERAISVLSQSPYTDKLNLHQIELELQNQDLLAIQHEYEKSFERYLTLFETAPTPYIIVNKNGLINEINQAGANLLGFEKCYLINRSFARYLSSESQILYSVFKQHCYKDKITQTCEVKFLSAHSGEHIVQLVGKQQISQVKNDNELLIIATPIHERNQANWNTFYNQKMSENNRRNSMTDLVAVIAHELNHPLAVILNYVQGCVRRIENNNFKIEEILSALKIAAGQSTRASEIILRMKEFKNYGLMNYEKVSIDDLINSTIVVLKEEIMDFPLLELRLGALPEIHADKLHIQQVISNLIRNAIDAMRDNNSPWPKLIIETNRTKKSEIEISIIDSGPGISPQILPHIFIPHFTTKNYGLGLGLAVSKSIIEAHNGIITAEPNPVGGTCFKLNLPIS